MGPDGKLYFGQGTATNTAVVGPDNFAYEWLRYFHDFHDRPGTDVVLTGRNYESPKVLGKITETVRTGAYVPFGTETTPGQVIKGDVKCSGAVLRCDPDGTGLELVAWGLRNPYGIAFAPDGRLFATEHGIDERNARHIIGDHEDFYEQEDFYEIVKGAWYGWPDFASGTRLDDPSWGDGGRGREPVLAEHPDPNPPKPFATLDQPSAPNGVDFCRDPSFGFHGDAFVALFGDLTPITGRLTPIRVQGGRRRHADRRGGRLRREQDPGPGLQAAALGPRAPIALSVRPGRRPVCGRLRPDLARSREGRHSRPAGDGNTVADTPHL